MNKNITDKESDILDLFNYELNTENLFITLGKKGSILTNGSQIIHQKSYPSEIVDTIGAGDTFFAFACLLASVEKNITNLTIPSLAASLSTTWLCNEKSVTKQNLFEHASRFIS